MSELKTINSSTFDEIKNSNGVHVIMFSTTWCGPCKVITPIIQEISSGFDNISFSKVLLDSEENKHLSAELGIRSVPTILFYKNKIEYHRNVGSTSKENLIKKINELSNEEETF